MIQTITTILCVCLFSVFMGHKESLGMRLCPWPIFIFDISLCLCTLHECDKWAEMIRMFILTSELQVGHSHYSWNVLSSPVTHWPLKLLTWFYFTIYSQSTFKTKVSLYTSPLSYKHCKLKWEIQGLNTSPTHFQCTGYLHIQMLIQTPLSDGPIIVFNTVVPCIRLIFNPMP